MKQGSMWKIDKNVAEKWHTRNGKGSKVPMHIDIKCPHEGCGKPTFSLPIEWIRIQNAAHACVRCAGCDKYINFYMTNPPTAKPCSEEDKSVIYQHI